MGKMKAIEANEVTSPPALIVFGRDESAKAHAAWFAEADAELAVRAAGLMGMHVLRVTTDEQRAIALELAVGKIWNQTGKGFVPFCKMAVFDRLNAFPEAFAPAAPEVAEVEPLPEVTCVPSGWDEVVVGSLVLANDGDNAGWFESIVIEDKGESLLVLRWRDWPDQPAFVRRRDDLGLLPPDSPAA
ncbi:hypothetical protein [Beijerinckia sp. L45]|uniref:hypothetical protein n=1 Tax=Beijerinckia sp. L45 TaxID=1641855 RepID=UPI00131D9175|nr:hypothetical protein [Beijerinckia sp. L45]